MNKIKQFLNDCKLELSKVVWPDKNERINTTWVVILSVIVLTLYVYGLDFVYLFTIKKLMN